MESSVNEDRDAESVVDENTSQSEQPPTDDSSAQTPKDDPLLTNLRNLRNDLSYMIDIEYGLLDELRSGDILTLEQLENIKSKPAGSVQISQVLDDVINASLERREQFLQALSETGQSHVANYIREGVHRTASNVDDWPLMGCEEEIRTVERNWTKLKELMDPRNGLVDELFAAECVNFQQKDRIENSGPRDCEWNEQLLFILRRKSFRDYQIFLRCLASTKQYHVLSLLKRELAGNSRPLSEKTKKRLTVNYASLVSLLYTGDGLLAEMLSKDCITRRQKEFIESGSSQSDCNKRLLNTFMRGSQSDFENFVECLDKTGHRHVGHILMEDGLVVRMDATTTTSNRDDTKQQESEVVERFMSLLQNVPSEYRQLLVERVNRQVEDLRARDVDINALKTQNSIGVYFLCKSLFGLQYLHEEFYSGRLAATVDGLFAVLQWQEADTDPVGLHIDTLLWEMSDSYAGGAQYLSCTVAHLPVLAEYYQFASLAAEVEATSSSRSTDGVGSLNPCELFPLELTEILLVRTAVCLFETINRLTPRAEAYSVAALCAVSGFWWHVLTVRPFIKRQLRRYFRRSCRPFRCVPLELPTLNVEGDCIVVGVAEADGELYVACFKSNVIHVYDSQPPFRRLSNLKVDGLSAAQDIVICSETKQLYIADWMQCAVWRVKLADGGVDEPADRLISVDWSPWSLTTRFTRLVVMPREGDRLLLHRVDGEQLRCIQLPEYMWASHAAETAKSTFFVCHRSRLTGDTEQEHRSVSEVDVDGNVIRRFGCRHKNLGPVNFNWPHYMVLDNIGNVIVADTFNERIVVLDSNLQLRRFLMSSLARQPYRFCFNRKTRTLFVASVRSTEITVYVI